MIALKDWMRQELVSDDEMADRIGAFSAEGVRKLRFRARGASSRVAARIHILTGGQVQPPDLVPASKPRRASPVPEAQP